MNCDMFGRKNLGSENNRRQCCRKPFQELRFTYFCEPQALAGVCTAGDRGVAKTEDDVGGRSAGQ